MAQLAWDSTEKKTIRVQEVKGQDDDYYYMMPKPKQQQTFIAQRRH